MIEKHGYNGEEGIIGEEGSILRANNNASHYVRIMDFIAFGYNGYWDGYYGTVEEGLSQLCLSIDSDEGKAFRKGWNKAIAEAHVIRMREAKSSPTKS